MDGIRKWHPGVCFSGWKPWIGGESCTSPRAPSPLLGLYVAWLPSSAISFRRYLWSHSGFLATSNYSPALSWVFAHFGMAF